MGGWNLGNGRTTAGAELNKRSTLKLNSGLDRSTFYILHYSDILVPRLTLRNAVRQNQKGNKKKVKKLKNFKRPKTLNPISDLNPELFARF